MTPPRETPLFGGRCFAGLLFDMDGTVLNSMAAVERVWGAWAVEHDLDPAALLATIHGVRAAESIRRLGLAGVDPAAEAERIAAAEIADLDGVTPIKGASDFLRSLPADRWGIVTSAPRALALRRLQAAGLPLPPVLITAEDVSLGKPDPSCYQLGAARLGFAVQDCLVFEDAAAGVEAAEAAGASLLVITAAHPQPLATKQISRADFAALRAVPRADGRLCLAASTE